MRRFKFAKIIRSKLIENIINTGGVPHIRNLNKEEYIQALFSQLECETKELIVSPKESRIEELSDVAELVDALILAFGKSEKELKKAQKNKRDKNGDFSDTRYVEFVDVQDDNKWIEYYLKNSDRYPELEMKD